jgi:hypothetical protein
VTLPNVGAARLQDTACHYVSGDGDEQSTTVRDIRLDAVAEGLPVRPIRSFAGQHHYPGLFWSVTTGKHVWYESLLERDRLLLADYDPDVIGIAAQPMWLVGKDNGVTRRHVPDLLLAHSDGSFMLVDVKPAEFAEHPEAVGVFGWTARICAARGWRYEVWTGAEATVLANVRQLAAGRRRELLDDAAVEAVQAAFRPGATIGDVETAAGRSPLGARRAVLWMLWTHQCRTDLTQPLSSGSILLDGGQR